MPKEHLEKGQPITGNNSVVRGDEGFNRRDGTTVFVFVSASPASDEAGVVVQVPESKSDLRQRTYELLSMVREPSAEERRFLTEKGFVFLPIEVKTLKQVVREHPDHFRKDDQKYIDKLPCSDPQTYVPMIMEVAFNPDKLYIPDSFGRSQTAQLAMTEKYSQTNLEKELPGAKALILPATVDAQADIAYFKKTNQVLFRDCFASTLDQMSDSDATFIGRAFSVGPLVVGGWEADYGHNKVGVPLAVVFLQE